LRNGWRYSDGGGARPEFFWWRMTPDINMVPGLLASLRVVTP
jgi:hypothetical protein